MLLDELDTEDDQPVVETSLLECSTWDCVSVAKRRGAWHPVGKAAPRVWKSRASCLPLAALDAECSDCWSSFCKSGSTPKSETVTSSRNECHMTNEAEGSRQAPTLLTSPRSAN